jgi:hypothetical protein
LGADPRLVADDVAEGGARGGLPACATGGGVAPDDAALPVEWRSEDTQSVGSGDSDRRTAATPSDSVLLPTLSSLSSACADAAAPEPPERESDGGCGGMSPGRWAISSRSRAVRAASMRCRLDACRLDAHANQVGLSQATVKWQLDFQPRPSPLGSSTV